jgi:tetratricopeptide (TPR) repeat protein
MQHFKLTLLLLFFIGLISSCDRSKTSAYKLGKINFEISGTTEAQEAFRKGFLLLHSFEYEDAAEEFRKAKTVDPDCAMAYWGEAMTYNHSIWQEQDYQKGKAVLMELAESYEARQAKAKSELEKDFIQAIEILYGEGSKTYRDKAYANYMAKLFDKYPDNHEVAAFYALSLLGSVTYGRSLEVYQQSASISKKILEENPEHPGALHYFIHANDEPEFAATAVLAANAYSVVAPDAAHALHMPSHIYLALGMWDEVVRSNEISWQASINRKARKNLDNNALGYHSFHWLQYGYLQQGKIEEAKQMLSEMVQYCKEFPSARARAHQIFLRSTYLVESNDWESIFASLETETKGINIAAMNRDAFVNGLKAYHMQDKAILAEVIDQVKMQRDIAAKTLVLEEGIALCSGGGASRENTTQMSLDLSDVMEMELRALLAVLNDELDLAENWFIKATKLEESVGAAYGPPAIVKPSHELYGEFLLANSRYSDALEMFNQALELAPQRALAIEGKLMAIQKLGETLSMQIGDSELDNKWIANQ